jgi:hypothetical protein
MKRRNNNMFGFLIVLIVGMMIGAYISKNKY